MTGIRADSDGDLGSLRQRDFLPRIDDGGCLCGIGATE